MKKKTSVKDLEAQGWEVSADAKNRIGLAQANSKQLALFERIAAGLEGTNTADAVKAAAAAIAKLSEAQATMTMQNAKALQELMAEIKASRDINLECKFQRNKKGLTKIVTVKSV